MKRLGAAETVVPVPRLGQRSLKPLPPPGERPSIVLLRGEGAELLRLGPRGSPGRRTVRTQLSWRSWWKFGDLRRGRAEERGPLPVRLPLEAGGGGRGAGRRGAAGGRR